MTSHDVQRRRQREIVCDSHAERERARDDDGANVRGKRKRKREGLVERGGGGQKKRRRRWRRRRRREDRYRHFPVSCHVLRRATFELYEETPAMNYSWSSPNLADAAASRLAVGHFALSSGALSSGRTCCSKQERKKEKRVTRGGGEGRARSGDVITTQTIVSVRRGRR